MANTSESYHALAAEAEAIHSVQSVVLKDQDQIVHNVMGRWLNSTSSLNVIIPI